MSRRPRRRGPRKHLLWMPAYVLAALAALLVLGLTAANTVASSRADEDNRTATAELFKPTECAGITVSTVIVGVNGGTTDDLLIGRRRR